MHDSRGDKAFEVTAFGPSAHPLRAGWPSPLRRARDLALENPLATQGWLPLRLLAYRPDLVHSTAFVGPLWATPPLVLTFHDLIYHHDPGAYDPLWLRVIETLAPHSLRRARAIIALSRCTADDLARTYKVPRRKIHVVPCGVDRGFFTPIPATDRAAVRARYGLVGPYLLHSGALVERKNLVMLVRAFTRYCRDHADSTTLLALTGRPAPGMPGAATLLRAIA
ncbi:MAG TPA: glycosyltransferase, partial [Chloroflexia bacterium]|nr:glycosyltransferase [Chloroflexia bacterium]